MVLVKSNVAWRVTKDILVSLYRSFGVRRRRSGFPAPTRTSEMRRVFSRMTPRTRKITSTAYRRYDVDRRRRVLLRCRQSAESRPPSRPRPRTFLVHDSAPPQSKPRPPSRNTGRDPLLQRFRRPCASVSPVRTFLQPEFGGNNVGCSCGRHIWRSRSGIITLPATHQKPNTLASLSASQTCSFTSHGRRACTGSRTECRWNSASRDTSVARQNGARTYRADDVQQASRRHPQTQRPTSASTVSITAPSAAVVRDGLGSQYRIRSFRYSRLHRRTIDAIVPEELRRLPQQWADRAAQQIEHSSSN